MYPYEILLGLDLYEIFLILGILLVFFLADRLAVKSGFSLALQKVFIVALAALAFMGCNKSKSADNAAEATNNTEVQSAVTTTASDIAVVDVIYVVNESEIAKTEGVALRNKIAKAEEKFAKKDQDLQKEMQQLAEKYQKGLITTRDAQTKEQELQKRAAALQQQAQKEVPALQEEEVPALQEEEMVLNNRVNDLIQRAIKAINADKKYKLIVNSTALLDADESLNITEQVLAKVNELYASENTTKKK